MPQPKSPRPLASRKPAAKPAARKPAAKSAASSKPVGRSTAAKVAAVQRVAAERRTSAASRKPAARRPAAKAPARKPAAAAAAAPADDSVRNGLAGLRETLRKGVVLTSDGLREAMDDAVKRGRITRRDAAELTQGLLDSGRRQADTLRADVEQLLGRGRRGAAQSSDVMLREVDRARRAVGVGPSFPISLYDELSAAQISKRVGDLTPAELRKVRDHERRNAKRATVLKMIERRLG